MKSKSILYSFFLILILIAALFYFSYMKPRRATPILVYHSISDDRQSSLSVTPENFSKQMAFLEKKRYSVISLDKLAENITAGKTYLPKTVVITFDDGYKDNFTEAFPVLEKYGMTATVFLITGYTGNKKEYLNWDQVRLMKKSGMDFGSHTRNNIYLPAENDPEKLWAQIAGSRTDIASGTGEAARFFCYPTGGFTEGVKEAVKKAGYKGACTTNRGYDRNNKDVYELNRIKITDSDMNKPFHFRAKLSGYYNAFRSYRSGG